VIQGFADRRRPLYVQHSLPEVDAFNFAPCVRVPVLLLNGRFDFFYSVDTSQFADVRTVPIARGAKAAGRLRHGPQHPASGSDQGVAGLVGQIPGESARVRNAEEERFVAVKPHA
jgi:hypothetical protein